MDRIKTVNSTKNSTSQKEERIFCNVTLGTWGWCLIRAAENTSTFMLRIIFLPNGTTLSFFWIFFWYMSTFLCCFSMMYLFFWKILHKICQSQRALSQRSVNCRITDNIKCIHQIDVLLAVADPGFLRWAEWGACSTWTEFYCLNRWGRILVKLHST